MIKVAVVRGKFLNAYEMQFFTPLAKQFQLTGFGSLTCYHDQIGFPVDKLPSPMDFPNFPAKLPLMNRLFTDAHYLLGLEEKLAGFDLVHTAETYFRYTQQCLDAKRDGKVKKVIATVLENIPYNNEGIWGRREYKARARAELDHIIALTQKTKQALISEGTDAKKITVIAHFIDTKRFSPAPEIQKRLGDPTKRQFTILFSGRLEEYKGVYELLQAAVMLVHDADLKDYFLQFVFVGGGSQKATMNDTEKELDIVKNVAHREVSYDDMPDVYRTADIFIAPSKSTATWQEQYCTVLLEAQAAGLPIVTTNSGGIPENIGDAGLLVPESDHASLARAIKRFLLEPKLRVTYAKKARNRAVTVHDIHIGARKLAALYRAVLDEEI